MKFKDIKAGDMVYIQRPLRYGFGGIREYWVPVKVERVTPKQIIIGKSKYWRLDGSKVGDSWDKICFLGDAYGVGRAKVSDQTEELNAFIGAIDKMSDISGYLDALRHVDIDDQNLSEICDLIKKAENLMNPK